MWELLKEAIEARDLKQVSYLIAKLNPLELEKRDSLGQTLLHIATKKSSSEICELLIPLLNTEVISAIDNQGRTALTYAVINKMQTVYESLILLTNNEAINAIDEQGCTVLTQAAKKQLHTACELLIPKMTNEAINAIDSHGCTVLFRSISQSLNDACQLLISGKAINVVNFQGYPTLSWAVSKDLRNICNLLIPKMTNEAINAIDKQGRTALTEAIKHGMNDITVRLISLSNQKSIDCFTMSYFTALSKAIEQDMTLVSKMLILLTPVEAIKGSRIYSVDSCKNLLEYTEFHGKVSLYKMLFAKVHSSYESAFGKKDETEYTDLVKSTKKSIFQLADFIIKSFESSNEPGLVTIQFEDFGKFKFYQQINRDLLESCIDHNDANGAKLLRKVDTYIAVKYFTIAGISPSINLHEAPANHIFSFLECPSLLAINTYEANAVAHVGESSIDTSLGG